MPVPFGTADLGHEARNHAVEDDAVIKAFTGKFLDPLDMAGGQVRAQLNRDAALGGFEEDRVFRVGHGSSCFLC
jgi:hypothetical protein